MEAKSELKASFGSINRPVHLLLIFSVFSFHRFKQSPSPPSMESQEDHVRTTATETASFWTDEKHLQFLSSIEASFVTAMLEMKSRSIHRLRRPLPDTSESTLDLKSHRTATANHRVSDLRGRRRRMKGRRSMRRRSEAYNSLQDQVVPQMRNGQEDITEDHDQTGT